MSRGTERVLVGYPAHARDPEARPSEECPPRRCARPPRCSSSLGHQVQEIAIEVEAGHADNFIKVWIAQTGDEVHTYERLCGRKLDVDQLSREMYELSSQINAPTTWARSIGCAATRGG
jgi:hypothetical protein